MTQMRGVTIVLLAASLVFVNATGAAAQIGPLIQGRHDVLRAEMYARAIDYGTPVQVLNRLCPRPGHEHGCEPVSNALRRAIDDTVTAPITWVGHKPRNGGDFWALAPLVRNGSHASFRVAFDHVLHCRGRGRFNFRRVDWTGWFFEGGGERVTCGAGI